MKRLVVIFLLCINLFAHGDKKTITHETYTQIKKIQELSKNNDNTKAFEKIKKLEKTLFARRASNYEKAFVQRFKGFMLINANQYKEAIEIFKKLYKENTLKEKEHNKLPYFIAQLYMAQERYFSAVKYFKKAYLTDQKNLTILESLGYAYNNLEYPNKSIYWIKKAIDIKPKKNLLEFLKVMYFNEKNYTKAIATQKKIFELYKYDSQGLFFIIGIYQLQNDSKNALSFLQIAYDMGYFTKEDDYLSFAYLLQSNRLYFQAAHTMSEGLKKQIVKKDTQNLRFIAQNYYEAKAYDDAIDSFKELIIIEDMSTNHIELAQIYMEHQHYEKAIDSLKKALDFKIKKELGKIELLIGINYFELKKFKEAKIHFTNAFQTSQKEDAKKWLEYLDKL